MAYYSAPGRGDYYAPRGRGDLGGFLKRVGKAAVGFVTGGVPGAVGGFLASSGGTRPAASTAVQIQQPSFSPLPSISISRRTGPVMGAHATPAEVAASLGMPPRRRMNPANPKALRRALRRVQGFGSLAARAAGDVAKANRSLNRIPRKAPKRKR